MTLAGVKRKARRGRRYARPSTRWKCEERFALGFITPRRGRPSARFLAPLKNNLTPELFALAFSIEQSPHLAGFPMLRFETEKLEGDDLPDTSILLSDRQKSRSIQREQNKNVRLRGSSSSSPTAPSVNEI